MLKTIRHLLELIRFSHTLFALPFAMLAAVMAWRIGGHNLDQHPIAEPEFSVRSLVGLLLCMVFARSFAMAFNRLADRHLDANNPRTAGRHLPAKILSAGQVAIFAIVCAIGFISSTLLFLPNSLPLLLSIPVLAFLGGYSYAKRFTGYAHFWLGAALALSPIATWIAIRGSIVMIDPGDLIPAIVLGGVVLTWVAGFDIIYACQDYEADLKANLHSVPAAFGVPVALQLAAGCHIFTIALLAFLPTVYPAFGWIYWAGVLAVAVLLIYEHLLVRPDDLSRVNAAFFNVNAVISIGLFIVGSLDLWVGSR
jgi:4-hydroxybenzoate polyprenyltransferase